MQRQRIDAGEGNATVLVGASRVYYDIQLPVWERLDGRRPIQLSFEGTSPLAYLEDLAADPKFVGRVLVGVEPDLFFSGYEYRGGAVRFTRKESPSQYIGQQLSMHLIEPYFAFDDPDFALETVLERQPWPERPGKHVFLEPRKLGYHEADRNSYVWDKVADDPEYHELWHRIWREGFQPSPDDPTPAEALKTEKEQIARAAQVVATLQGAWREGAVRAHAEQRRISRLRESRVPARQDLERAARRHRGAGDSFRGLPGVAGLLPARMVAHDTCRGRAFHRSAVHRDHA